MSEKSKGDTSSSSTSRIVNNPLLSANVTNLTFDDFQNKPVILPAAPPIIHAATEDVSESSSTTKRTVTVGETPDIDADTLSEINLNTSDDDQQQQQQQQQQFQQIDLNDNNAFPQIQHEPRLINNNEIADDSILSQAASSFSQLPSVASTVLSTFSKVINNYSPGQSATISREQSSERDLNANNSGGNNLYQQQQHNINQTPGLEQFPGSNGFSNQYLNQSQNSSSVATPEPPKLYTPPPAGSNIIQQKTPNLPPPLTAGGNTYRLSSKKKTYAQIPGLSVNHSSTADTDSQSIPSSQNNNLITTELSNTASFQTSTQPINSFLNEINTPSDSQTIFGGYTPDPYYQQQTQLPKSDKSSSSSVGGLLSGVSGVIQNLSGFVKSTVTSDSNQSIQATAVDHSKQYNYEPQFVEGFTPPPVAFCDTAVTNSQVFNPTIGHQIGFEAVQSSIPLNLNQPAGPPPTKPPAATSGGSSFRLQKGTRLYKSPFEQSSSVSGVIPPYPTSLSQQQQQPGFANLPPLPANFEQTNQELQISKNFAPIPAPESFQSYPPQNIQTSHIFNPVEQTQPTINYFNPQATQNIQEQVVPCIPIQQESIQPELNCPPRANLQKTEFVYHTTQGVIPEASNLRPPSRQKTPSVTPIGSDSLPQQVSIQQSQLEYNTVGSLPSTAPSFTPFLSSVKNNNQIQFNSIAVEGQPSNQEALLHKTAELNLQDKPSFAPPPPKVDLPVSGVANPFRKDSTKSHHTTAFRVPQQVVQTNLPVSSQTTSLDNTSPQQSFTSPLQSQASLPEKASTVDFFNPVTTGEWAQQIIKEAKPNITDSSVVNPLQSQPEFTLEPAQPFPEKFNFSSVLSGEYTKFNYLPPSVKSKPRTESVNSENNCPPPPAAFRPPAPLPSVNGQPQIGPEASVAAFYNPVPSHEWAQQVINAAHQGLSEIPQQNNSDNSRILQGTIEPVEDFPNQFDFSSVIPQEGQIYKYLPPPIDNKLTETNPEESKSLGENVKILKITKETLPEGTPSCVGEYLTEASKQSQTANLNREENKDQGKNISDSPQYQNTNLSTYFGQQQDEQHELHINNNLGNIALPQQQNSPQGVPLTSVNTSSQSTSAPQVPEKASTVDYFNPVTTTEWAQQVLQEANPNITDPSVLTPVQPQSVTTLEPSEPFPEQFNFSTLLSGGDTKFNYLPPSVKTKQRTDSEKNCPPPTFKPPVPLPIVNGQLQIGPEASIAAFYNPTPSHEWAQQVVDAAHQGLSEISQETNSDNSRILQGTIDPEEEFPNQFNFSSVIPQEGPAFRYLPSPVDHKLKATYLANKEILAQETLSEQPKASNQISEAIQIKDNDNNNSEIQNTNLANYFGQEKEKQKEIQSINNLRDRGGTLAFPNQQQQQQQQEQQISNPVQQNFFQSDPTSSTSSTPQLTDFFNSNQIPSLPAQQFFPKILQEAPQGPRANKENSISKATAFDKNLNYNVSEKSTPGQQQNLFSNFFQQPNQQQQISANNNQGEFQNIIQQQQNQSQHQQQQLHQQQQTNSAVSFFDQFGNNNNSAAAASTTLPSSATNTAPGQLLNEEDPRIQNFFNNPPPQNLNNNSVNELNFKNLYGCGGFKTKQFIGYSESINSTSGRNNSDNNNNRSPTPSSNIVEPPSSACSEFSSDYLNNSVQNLNNNTQNIIGFSQKLSDSYLDEIPDELISEYNKMSVANTTNSSVPCNVVYTPAKKHWFYKKIELSKQIWTPFTHKDSDALEESFLKKDRNIVPVEGGRYDVNITERTRVPIYWKGDPTEVRRCSWFFKSVDSKYVPYEEETADFLESEYREASNSGEWRKKVSLGNGETVAFHAPTVLVHFLQAQTSDAWGGASQSTIKPRVVKRDLDDFIIEAGETDKVDHLLFMIHGIGSACDLKFRGVEEVVEEFRSIAYQLVQAHYKNSVDNGDVGRVEVLPVSWHHELHSAECGIDEQLKAITLESIPKLRNFSNDTVVDVLFYTSPVFCQYIINTVANCMNRVFLKFCQRNTNFSGQVSLAGHSLGSLILFDLLCNQKPIEDNETNSETLDQYLEPQKVPTSAHSKQVSYTFGTIGAGQPTIEYPQLLFAPKKFFALGSPIGLFVTVRGIGKLGLDFKFPTCPGFYNIFHPYDPIAYRIEALINPELSSVRPVLIPHHKGRKRMHLELKETMTRVGTEVKQRIAEIFKGTLETVFFLSSKNKAEDQQEMEKEVDKVLDIQLKMDQPIRTESLSNSDLQSVEDLNEINMAVGKLNDSKRVDYVLQEAPLEFFNEYLFALTSHVCYWDSEDTILFLVKEIYSSIGISTDATVPQQNMTIERPSSRNTPTSSPTLSPQQKLYKEFK